MSYNYEDPDDEWDPAFATPPRNRKGGTSSASPTKVIPKTPGTPKPDDTDELSWNHMGVAEDIAQVIRTIRAARRADKAVAVLWPLDVPDRNVITTPPELITLLGIISDKIKDYWQYVTYSVDTDPRLYKRFLQYDRGPGDEKDELLIAEALLKSGLIRPHSRVEPLTGYSPVGNAYLKQAANTQRRKRMRTKGTFADMAV